MPAANTDGWGNKLVTIFARHLDSFIMALNLSLIFQIRDFGSGHPDSYRDLQPRQFYLSPGFARPADARLKDTVGQAGRTGKNTCQP
jgi:hypothetical protein